MSTILDALRRLQRDRAREQAGGDLKQSLTLDTFERPRRPGRVGAWIVLAAIVIAAGASALYLFVPRADRMASLLEAVSPEVAPEPASDPAAVAGAPAEAPNVQRAARRIIRPTPDAESEPEESAEPAEPEPEPEADVVARAPEPILARPPAVVPAPAPAAAPAAAPRIPAPPAPAGAASEVASARAPAPARSSPRLAPRPAATQRDDAGAVARLTSREAIGSPRPSPARAAAHAAPPTDLPTDPLPFPNLTLSAIRWHPEPSRRQAQLLYEGMRPLEAREGDIVSGVAIHRIDPDGVELRLGDRHRRLALE